MKKWIISSLLVLLLIGQQPAIGVTPKIGSKCLELKQIIKVGSTVVVCANSKGKTIWRKATPAEVSRFEKNKSTAEKAAAEKAAAEKAAAEKAAAEKAAAEKAAAEKICVVGGKCAIGSTGPGGGIVFYDAKSQQSWGRYLEVAPNGWGGSPVDPGAKWCNVTNQLLSSSITDPVLKARIGDEIGSGKSNTDLMVSNCTSGAGNLAREYRGGGKSDWFLPSRNELIELCKFVRGQTIGDPSVRCVYTGYLMEGFIGYFLWSSSESSATSAWGTTLGAGGQIGSAKNLAFYVRPVRAF
jgi:hypothetical protein